MNDSHVTQCPHCQTRFRVTAAQLGMAHGAVRCGACLKVFNAAEQLGLPVQPFDAPPADGDAGLAQLAAGTQAAGLAALNRSGEPAERPRAAPPLPPVETAPARPQPEPEPEPDDLPRAADNPPATPQAPGPARAEQTLWIHDDLDLDSLDLDEELAKLEPDSFELSQELRHRQPPQMPSISVLDEPREPHDESWAEALLLDQSPRADIAVAEEAAPGQRRTAEPTLTLDAMDDLDAFDSLDEALADPEDDAREAAHLRSLSAQRDGAPARHTEAGARQEPQWRDEPRLRDESLRHLQDEPLQLDWQPPRPQWGRRLLWAVLLLLALAALAGQYLYFNFDALARQERWRPWLEQLCQPLGCALPARVDVGQIKSSNLVVRSHPRHPGALSVDAILYNRADFAQPFPLLELRFEDLNGRALASRRFKPAEYLAGELAGSLEMPPQTPIHIALEILDPGAQAVNYRLEFHSPD